MKAIYNNSLTNSALNGASVPRLWKFLTKSKTALKQATTDLSRCTMKYSILKEDNSSSEVQLLGF